MVESGTTNAKSSVSSQSLPQAKPFPLPVNRVPVSTWGCRSITSGYVKKYKVGQGSYGFDLIFN